MGDQPTKFQRSEDDILQQAPIKVHFGDRDYDVKPLRILAAREWRATLVAAVQDIGARMAQPADNTPVFLNGLAFIFLQFPEKMAELFFGYARELPRKEIEDTATEEQLARAFGQIVQVAFPFVQELQAITRTMGMAASFPQLARRTN